MFRAECNTYKYQLIQKGKVVHRDITYDLTRREAEHQKTYPASHVRQIGRKTTRKDALRWQRQGVERRFRGSSLQKAKELKRLEKSAIYNAFHDFLMGLAYGGLLLLATFLIILVLATLANIGRTWP